MSVETRDKLMNKYFYKNHDIHDFQYITRKKILYDNNINMLHYSAIQR